jgi:hypothetical protein
MQQWEVFYYKNANFYYWLIVPFILAVFTPMFFATSDRALFEKLEPHFGKLLMAGTVIFMLGFIAVYRIKTKKHNAMLILQHGAIRFLNNEIVLADVQLIYGRYGIPASGSLGTIFYLKNADRQMRIGILEYTLKNVNKYTAPWSMKVDCFLDKRNVEPLLNAIENRVQTLQPLAADFRQGEAVFELRTVAGFGANLLLFYGFISIPILIMLVFSITHPMLISLMILTAIAGLIFYKLKQDAKGQGFFLVFGNGLVKLLHLHTRKEILSVPLTTLTTQVYLKKIYGRTGSYTWLTLQMNLPDFKKITIGQSGPLGSNIWEKSGLPEKALSFSGPQFKVDKPTWNKIADCVGVVLPFEG